MPAHVQGLSWNTPWCCAHGEQHSAAMGTLPHHGDIHMEMPAAGGVLALWQCCRAVLGPAFPPNTRCGSSTPYLPYTPVLSPTAYSCHLPRAASQGPPPQGAQPVARSETLQEGKMCPGADVEAADNMFLLGWSCPFPLISNNNPCPWSTPKNSPAPGSRGESTWGARAAATGRHPSAESQPWPQPCPGVVALGPHQTQCACMQQPNRSVLGFYWSHCNMRLARVPCPGERTSTERKKSNTLVKGNTSGPLCYGSEGRAISEGTLGRPALCSIVSGSLPRSQ